MKDRKEVFSFSPCKKCIHNDKPILIECSSGYAKVTPCTNCSQIIEGKREYTKYETNYGRVKF